LKFADIEGVAKPRVTQADDVERREAKNRIQSPEGVIHLA
jgi:hypothetical protein